MLNKWYGILCDQSRTLTIPGISRILATQKWGNLWTEKIQDRMQKICIMQVPLLHISFLTILDSVTIWMQICPSVKQEYCFFQMQVFSATHLGEPIWLGYCEAPCTENFKCLLTFKNVQVKLLWKYDLNLCQAKFFQRQCWFSIQRPRAWLCFVLVLKNCCSYTSNNSMVTILGYFSLLCTDL